jgi:hypothetical protein
VVRETAVLTSEQRRLVDSELAAALAGEWGGLGDTELGHQVRAVVYRWIPTLSSNELGSPSHTDA